MTKLQYSLNTYIHGWIEKAEEQGVEIPDSLKRELIKAGMEMYRSGQLREYFDMIKDGYDDDTSHLESAGDKGRRNRKIKNAQRNIQIVTDFHLGRWKNESEAHKCLAEKYNLSPATIRNVISQDV